MRLFGSLLGRLIPAHAGKTSRLGGASLRSGAHPRSRGENISPRIASLRLRGSSPLTRGKRHRQRDRLPSDRLIPAHAGKTGRFFVGNISVTAHPRSRGENQ